jgi:hypothetical protein
MKSFGSIQPNAKVFIKRGIIHWSKVQTLALALSKMLQKTALCPKLDLI